MAFEKALLDAALNIPDEDRAAETGTNGA